MDDVRELTAAEQAQIDRMLVLDRAQRRSHALQQALIWAGCYSQPGAVDGHAVPAEQVLEAARAFEAYLTEEGPAPDGS